MLDSLDKEILKSMKEAFEEGLKRSFSVKYEHGIIWIDTGYERFCYEPNYPGEKIRLMHENKLGSFGNKGFDYHEQFCWEITTKDLFDWIEGHTNHKYIPKERK